jgi:phage tail sheath protein FI
VLKPNDERLWSQLRLSVGAFMHRLFTLGAFGSNDPDQAYLVKCDADTTSADDQQRGVVNLVVGFLPAQVTEFVVIQHQILTRPAEV